MNLIESALQLGHDPAKIISFLANVYPQVGKKLKAAQKAGYKPTQILNFLGNTFGRGETVRGGGAAYQTLLERSRGEHQVKNLGKAGLAVAGTLAAGRLIPAALQGAQKLIGSTAPQVGPSPMANAPVQPPSVQVAAPVSPASSSPIPISTPPVSPIQEGATPVSPTPTTSPVTPPPRPNTPQPQQELSPKKQRAVEFLKSLDAEQRVAELAREGKTPEQIAAELQTSMHPSKRKSYQNRRMKGEVPPISQVVKDYLTTEEGFLSPDVMKFGKEEEPPEEKLVATPDGILGEVQHVRNKEALVKDEEGKLHKAKAEDLIPSPLPRKDLADLFDELNGEIHKESGEEVSRAVRMMAYHPESNTLLFVPWDGVPYIYENIPESDVHFLTNVLHKRKTSGESLIGAWEEGTKSPMGSQMSTFIRRLQSERGGKGNEYKAKFQTVYDPHELAIKAKKKKDEGGEKEMNINELANLLIILRNKFKHKSKNRARSSDRAKAKAKK